MPVAGAPKVAVVLQVACLQHAAAKAQQAQKGEHMVHLYYSAVLGSAAGPRPLGLPAAPDPGLPGCMQFPPKILPCQLLDSKG